MPIYPDVICIYCKHFDQEEKERHPLSMKCKAFPNGIPVEIKRGRADHRLPYKDDKGFRFEPIESPDELAPHLRREEDTKESIRQIINMILGYINNGGDPDDTI